MWNNLVGVERESEEEAEDFEDENDEELDNDDWFQTNSVNIFAGQPVTDRKSKFQAFLSPVHTYDLNSFVPSHLQHGRRRSISEDSLSGQENH